MIRSTDAIPTKRLVLIPLTQAQLELGLSKLSKLEDEIKTAIARDFVTGRVQRAIRMKVEKMRTADVSQHVWLTYWLIIIKEENVGAGMLGFKSYLNVDGSTEIGYGIDPAYQNKGYVSEAVKALIDWAFSHPFCKVITATDVYNPASKRLLEKLGATMTEHNDKFTSWEIRKL